MLGHASTVRQPLAVSGRLKATAERIFTAGIAGSISPVNSPVLVPLRPRITVSKTQGLLVQADMHRPDTVGSATAAISDLI